MESVGCDFFTAIMQKTRLPGEDIVRQIALLDTPRERGG